jgi:type IV conjugative transfer system coupling protein TraD
MFKQVTKVAILLAVLFWISLFIYQIRSVSPLYLQSSWYYEKACFYRSFNVKTMNVNPTFWRKLAKQNNSDNLSVERVILTTKPYASNFFQIAKNNLQHSGAISGGFLVIVLSFFFLYGRRSTKKHHIKGNRLSFVWWVALKLKLTRSASNISIGPLPLVKGTETQHILVTGGTGSGKTNCFHHILGAIEKRGQRAIIVDTTGILTERYYNPELDVILNPFDPRGATWHPWIECMDKTSYDAMAESFIPHSHFEGDNYWRTSARIVFSSILQQLDYSRKNSELANKLLLEPLANLCEFVLGTKAASQLDMKSEKTAASVRSVISNYLNCFEFLSDTEQPFSIRNWVHQDEDNKGWLFINCKTNQRSALNPLIACWFSVAVRSLLELPPNFDRRLWFIIDELPTLNRLRDLESLLAESRKYGGCALLALQSPSQLEAIYGRENTQTILGNCSTKVVFAEQNPSTAAKICEIFGEQETKEFQKGLSYGANDIRDGVSLNLHTKQELLISKTDIQFLKRNQAFVRLSGNQPIVKLKLPIFK